MYIAGIVIFLFGLILGFIYKHIPLTIFLNPTAIFILLFSLFGVLTATRGFRVLVRGFKAAMSPYAVISEDDRGRAASLFRLLSKTTALAMALITLIGFISAMGNIEDTQAMAEALAAAIMGAVIGLFLIAAVFEPAVAILKRRQDEERRRKAKN